MRNSVTKLLLMGLISSVAALAPSPALATGTPAKKNCSTALENLASDQESRLAVESSPRDVGPRGLDLALGEIASLVLEKAQVAQTSDSALLSLVEKNIQLKITEYEVRAGHELDLDELKIAVRQKELDRQREAAEAEERKRGVRRREGQGGLDWTLEAVPLKKNFLPENHSLPPGHVELESDQTGASTVIYHVDESEASQRGIHRIDVRSGQDLYIGELHGQVIPYHGPNEDLLVALPWAESASKAEVKILDSKTLQGRTFKVMSLNPDLKKAKHLGQLAAYPYQKRDGELGLILSWSHGFEQPSGLYEFDTKTGKVKSLGEVGPRSRIWASRDRRHVYSLDVTDARGRTPTKFAVRLVVKELTSRKILFKDTLDFGEYLAHMSTFDSSDVLRFETADGHLHLAVNLYGSREIQVRDITSRELKVFERKQTDTGSGRFVESENGDLYFLPNPSASHDGTQPVINLRTGTIERHPFGVIGGFSLVGVSRGSWMGPLAFYEVSVNVKDTTKNVLLSLPIAEGGPPAAVVDLKAINATELLQVETTPDGRVIGLFLKDDSRPGGGYQGKNNLHLIQLYGPPGAGR